MNLLKGQDEVSIFKLIMDEDIEDGPEQLDSYSQMAISMELLFSNAEVSDREFASIGEALGLLEAKVRQDLIQGLCQSPAN